MNDLKGCSLIVAVDPGVSGYIATLDVNTLATKLYPIPTKTKKKLRRWKNDEKKRYIRSKELDEPALRELLKNIVNPIFPPYAVLIVLEHQAIFPGQGGVSGGKILYIYGWLKCELTRLHSNVLTPLPKTWKKAVGAQAQRGATRHQRKTKSWLRANDLFPEMADQLKPKSYSLDKSDALLLTLYGYQYLKKKGLINLSDDALDTEPALI